MKGKPETAAAASAIMTVKEVAEYLRMSEAKVYRLAREGALPVVRIGKSWRFRKDLLETWLEQASTPDEGTTRE